MGKRVLPYEMRADIMDLMEQGHSNDSIHGIISPVASEYVKSERQLTRCISTIRGHHNKGRRPCKTDDEDD
jgi:hypothetical protein